METTGVGPVILCLAHLEWDGVWQRPQQILSRLAARFPVAYVNEPYIAPDLTGPAELVPVAETGGLAAWQPLFPDEAGVIGRWRDVYTGVVEDLLIRCGWAKRDGERTVALRPIVLWFYTPTPHYLAGRLPVAAVVYDVMDDLGSFAHAGGDLPEREAALLARADLTFAGGPSIHAARRARRPDMHLFPSGVEPAHFRRALDPELAVPSEIARLPRPVLGYTGVVDERLDLDLLRVLAEGRPDASIVLVGPISSKLHGVELPRMPNLHFLGARPYAHLPAYLKGFDACLMPFALNRATRSISPTKALEYLAAGRPVVSTPVPDVQAQWADVVQIAEGASAFAAAVDRALTESEQARAARAVRAEVHVERSTWDRIAAEMAALLEQTLTLQTAPLRPGRGIGVMQATTLASSPSAAPASGARAVD